jgi:ketosteroid isomerase-like protein
MVYAAASAGDLDAMLSVFAEDVVWDVSRFGLGTHTGVAAIRRFVSMWADGFDDWEIRPWLLEDMGNGVVLAASEQLGHSKGNPEPFHMEQTSVWLWSGGLVAEATHYMDPEEARRAARHLAHARAAVGTP